MQNVTLPRFKTALDAAAARLRTEVLSRDSGSFLGNEEALQALLGVSKPTMRQAARLLEREGLLRVKRGNSGGYFGSRPDPDFVEATISTYLEVLNAEPLEMTTISSILYVEAVRRAAASEGDAAQALAVRYRNKVKNFPDTDGFSELLELEQKIRRELFDVIKSPYIELIFRINTNFSRRHFAQAPSDRDATPEHLEFVASWRKSKLMELHAIAEKDQDVAAMAARRTRDLLARRVWGSAQNPAGRVKHDRETSKDK